MSKATTRLALILVLASGALQASNLPPTEQAPTLADLLSRASDYHAEYVNKVSGAALEELYQLIDVTGGKMSAASRIGSDVVFVNLNGGVAALRDVYAIDTKPTRERTPRIVSLLASPTASTRDWQTAIQYPAQGAMYFGIDIILKVNEPTFALRFISKELQGNLKYTLDGRKKINGVETAGLRFEEPVGQDKQYISGSRGNARASGRVWVDVTTGAIHLTELWLDSKAETANITVKYAPSPTVNLILPTETTETYEEREAASGPRDFNRGVQSGRSGNRISFQATAKYSKPTYSAIDLRQLKR